MCSRGPRPREGGAAFVRLVCSRASKKIVYKTDPPLWARVARLDSAPCGLPPATAPPTANTAQDHTSLSSLPCLPPSRPPVLHSHIGVRTRAMHLPWPVPHIPRILLFRLPPRPWLQRTNGASRYVVPHLSSHAYGAPRLQPHRHRASPHTPLRAGTWRWSCRCSATWT